MKILLRIIYLPAVLSLFILPAQVFAQDNGSGSFNNAVPGRYLFDVYPKITEVSSVVYDPDEGIAWVLGDSGSGARIARINIDDNETEVIDIIGAENIDWEALVLTDAGDLWILDVGDNNAKREDITFYRVRPELLADNMTLNVIRSIQVSYPEGPMNVEAAVVKDDRIYFFEKISIFEFKKAKMLSVDISDDAEAIQIAEEEGRLPVFFSITDASLSSKGVLYVLTYYGIFECYFWQEDYSLSFFSKFFFLGQQESMAVMESNLFLVGVESGYFYRIRKWLPFIPI